MKKVSLDHVSQCALIFSVFFLTAFAGTLLLHAQESSFHGAPASARQVKNPYAGQVRAVRAGKGVYTHNCGACHGNTGQGAGNVPPLVHGAVQTTPDGEIFWYITRGDASNGMPSWAALPERQRWEVVAYVKSLNNPPPAGAPTKAPVAQAIKAKKSTAPPPEAPFTDYRFEEPGTVRHIKGHRPSCALCHRVGHRRTQSCRAASECLAESSEGLQSGAVCDRVEQSAHHPDRSQRRFFPG